VADGRRCGHGGVKISGLIVHRCFHRSSLLS
jgi:hypothetical protein